MCHCCCCVTIVTAQALERDRAATAKKSSEDADVNEVCIDNAIHLLRLGEGGNSVGAGAPNVGFCLACVEVLCMCVCVCLCVRVFVCCLFYGVTFVRRYNAFVCIRYANCTHTHTHNIFDESIFFS